MLGDSDASSAQRLGHGRAAGRLGPSHGPGHEATVPTRVGRRDSITQPVQ